MPSKIILFPPLRILHWRNTKRINLVMQDNKNYAWRAWMCLRKKIVSSKKYISYHLVHKRTSKLDQRSCCDRSCSALILLQRITRGGAVIVKETHTWNYKNIIFCCDINFNITNFIICTKNDEDRFGSCYSSR